MKLVTFVCPKNGEETPGIVREGRAYCLSAFGLPYQSLNELIVKGKPEEWDLLRNGTPSSAGKPLAEVKLLAPIPHPLQDVLCLGLNYREHAKEANAYSQKDFTAERGYPVYFSKRVSYAPASGESVPSYEGLTEKLDYEAELAVVLGKDAKNVSEKDAEEYVLGYTVVNDMTARDLQTNHKQWYFGKSLDGFCPMGPVIVTKDEIPFPPALKIQSYVNGELRQDSNTDQMIYDIPFVISELSKGMTLKAGTIIATGTPKGVAMGMEKPRFLQSGDRIVCRIEKIGDLENTVE